MRDLPVRKNIRLEGYDYSREGCYFVTICVKGGHYLLWDDIPVGAAFGRPQLSEIGLLIDAEIMKIKHIYDCVEIDNYVIMPNHIHMIIRLSHSCISNDGHGRPKAAPTVSRIMNMFKSSISKQLGYSIWQKLFHDHIIRNEDEYSRISKYINENPFRWNEDSYFAENNRVDFNADT